MLWMWRPRDGGIV